MWIPGPIPSLTLQGHRLLEGTLRLSSVLNLECPVTRATHLCVSPHLPSDTEVYLLRDYRPMLIAFFIVCPFMVSHDTTTATSWILEINTHKQQRVESARQTVDGSHVGQEDLRYRYSCIVTNSR